MTIRQMQVFAAVCEEGSITKAAESLYLTQPAVSRMIKELTNECAFMLFEKVGGKLKPTAEAMELLPDVVDLLDQFRSVEKKFYGGATLSNVNIGCNMPIGIGLMFNVIEKFEDIFPHTRFNIFEDKWLSIKQKLFDRELDFAIITGYEENSNFVYHHFSDVEFCWVCDNSNSIAEERDVSLARLAEERLVLPDISVANMESQPSEPYVNLHPSWTTINAVSTLKAVMDMGFVSYMPVSSVLRYLEKGKLKRIDTSIGRIRKLYFVYLPNHKKCFR